MNKNPRMHDGHFKRIRDKVMKSDLYDFDDTLITEMILQCIFVRADTNEIAKALLLKYGNFLCMAKNAVPKDLLEIKGLGKTSAEKLCALLRTMYSFRMRPGSAVIPTEPMHYNELLNMLKTQFENIDYERFMMFVLNFNDEITFSTRLNEGDSEHVLINKKHIVDLARRQNATSIVLAHNHPTEGMYPSFDDVRFTAEIYKLLKAENITLKDHLIVSNQGIFSFQSSHMLKSIALRVKYSKADNDFFE